jgi:hypothetical protein
MRRGAILCSAVALCCACGSASSAPARKDVVSAAAPGALGRHFSFPTGSISPGPPAPNPSTAKPAHCADVTTAHAGSFVILTGTLVALPADNALARDRTVVQPGSVPIAHYGVGLDDGTAVCAVYLPDPPVALGGHLRLVAQVVLSSGGGVWFGWNQVLS